MRKAFLTSQNFCLSVFFNVVFKNTVAYFRRFPGSAALPEFYQDISFLPVFPPRSFSFVWVTSWKGALAAQFEDVEGLDCSIPLDYSGPLVLTHVRVW